MKTTRKNVFETNSSSTHSISLESGTYGVLTIQGDDFGWEIEEYYDAWTKANYCRVDAQYNEDALEMLKEVIEEVTGLEVVIEECEGYIDHQSSNTTFDEGVFDSRSNLKDFIFNSNSVLYTDNDNHC